MKYQIAPVAILAGGLATRLRPVTETMPKALIPVNGEPFIFHQLRLLQRQGVQRVVLCLGYLGEMVEQVVRSGSLFEVDVGYSYDCSLDASRLLGTAGAIKKALPLLDEYFFVLYGDSYLSCNYATVQETFIASNKQALMTIFHNDSQWDTSNVEYRGGELIAYSKRERTQHMHYIDYGLGMFHQTAFDLVPEKTTYDLALLYENLLKQQQLACQEVSERFYEVGSFTGIEEFEDYLKEFACNS